MQDVFTCMRESHSARSFASREVPEAELQKILEAGTWAPSAGNLQPWYFFVVKNPDIRQQLREACFDQEMVEKAPVVIVLLADPARSNERYGERGAQLYCLQDTAAAAQNMLLAAQALGLGSCWVGSFDEVEVQKIVEAPPRLRAVALLCIGYSEQDQEEKKRFGTREVSKILH